MLLHMSSWVVTYKHSGIQKKKNSNFFKIVLNNFKQNALVLKYKLENTRKNNQFHISFLFVYLVQQKLVEIWNKNKLKRKERNLNIFKGGIKSTMNIIKFNSNLFLFYFCLKVTYQESVNVFCVRHMVLKFL